MENTNLYGANEINGLLPGKGQEYHDVYADAPTVDWKTPGLKITRFRVVGDLMGQAGWIFDVSYVHGILKGEPVRVSTPFHQFFCSPRYIKAKIVQECKKYKVYAKGLGILDSLSVLY